MLPVFLVPLWHKISSTQEPFAKNWIDLSSENGALTIYHNTCNPTHAVQPFGLCHHCQLVNTYDNCMLECKRLQLLKYGWNRTTNYETGVEAIANKNTKLKKKFRTT